MKYVSVRMCATAIMFSASWPSIVSADDYGLSQVSIEHAATLRDTAMAGSGAYAIVESLTTEVGPRLAGSEAEARARDWGKITLQSLGFDNVRIETFEMEAWERGEEYASLVYPYPQPLRITALGGSVATPPEGLEGEVAIFDSLDSLEAAPLGSLDGRIAYVGHAMQATQDGSSYSFYGKLRREGASIAAARGASAIMIRSIGTDNHRMPHTGQMRYSEDAPRIPAAALSNPDADQIERIALYGKPIRAHLKLTPRSVGTRLSGNVMGEIVGWERPEEIIVIGGHLDSWDQGTGAVDDGAGIGIATAAAKLILDGGKRPRRTIRVIYWGAEEVGLLGGSAYLEAHRSELGNHVIGTESDFGAGRAWQMNAQVSKEGQAVVDLIGQLVAPIGIARGDMDKTGSGPDLTPMVSAGLPSFRFTQNGMDYFDLHHTPDDTLDKIEPAALDQNVAAFAVFAWLAANSTVDFRRAVPPQ
ncbi:MAG: hypothetical protein ACJAZ0_003106 [Halioglobus sp.]|jgi:carboxypeptidase Q